MSIHELSEEQVHSMTLQQKDEWWLKNVYKGNMPQLNLRSAMTGMILGGVLSLTNLYIGIKTGWTLGVGISSVILSFALFKLLSKLKIGREMTILENNAMQSIATSAGYMTAPLMASMPAYMMVTGQVVPMWQTFWWIIVLSLLGVLFAFPLKKRFINDEQLPFPEGRAAGIVLDNLHSEEGNQGMFKAKLLMFGAGLSALIEVMRSEVVMKAIKLPFLQLPAYWDDFIYKFSTPKILGTPLKDLTIQVDTSIVMLGTGGLMNLKTAMSLLLGAFLNYFVLAPIMIQNGAIEGPGFKNITMWSLWAGASMMTTSSLYSFFSKPQVFVEAFHNLVGRNRKTKKKDILEEIELPMWIFVVGIPIMGAITVYLGHVWFGIHYWLGLIAIPLVFVFTLIAVTSTGLTAVTPGGALGKLTQITYSVLAPGNIPTNLMTAGITSEVSLNASNLLMDIKPAYMLGGKPRHQALGHILGVFAGALVAVPVFYAIFDNDIALFTTDKLPLPGAAIWKAVAEVLTKGLSTLHPTAQIAVLVGAVVGLVCEIAAKRTRGRFPISGIGLGLAFVLRFTDSFAMALGALIFWFARRQSKDPKSLTHRALVDNQETLCAGIIAGGSIIGIILILLENVVLKGH
ncbi:MAG: OPT/YSL family transporter [Bdellovibrionaceae bacterium]|nr:OPT/YSL family transporter [Pseudobdellovibrionaceae bacterium]MBX3032869.1 OPT/YSL family transporter [Pseudobdellovibrionaceae bacterium]